TPEMNDEKKKAIESITFHPGFKVALKFKDKFYPDAINCKVENGQKGFYDMAFKKDAQTNVLGFLCTGDETQKYYDLNSEQEMVSSLLQELDKMFDGKATELYSGDYILENWGQYEFTQGTWTQAMQEKKSHLKVLNLPLDNKVYFAGEVYDIYQQMGVAGAILSGYHAVDKILTDE
ncbi:MAG: FAD-dependent oxidoreductase, partial [Spirosomataceae bacterium]